MIGLESSLVWTASWWCWQPTEQWSEWWRLTKENQCLLSQVTRTTKASTSRPASLQTVSSWYPGPRMVNFTSGGRTQVRGLECWQENTVSQSPTPSSTRGTRSWPAPAPPSACGCRAPAWQRTRLLTTSVFHQWLEQGDLVTLQEEEEEGDHTNQDSTNYYCILVFCAPCDLINKM